MRKVQKSEWGKITIDNLSFKDVKVSEKILREWDWKETGTAHQPGTQVSDIKELLDGIEFISISTGHEGKLGIDVDTISELNEHSIEYFLGNTPKAIEVYNKKISEGVKCAGLFHSTC